MTDELLLISSRAEVRDGLSRFGWAASTAEAANAVRLANGRRFTLGLVDVADDRDALVTVRVLRAHAPSLPLIAIVEPHGEAMASEALQAGAVDVLPWPFEARDLAPLIADARDRMVPEAESEIGPSLVALSPAMRAVRDLAARASASAASVLVVGEPGSGRVEIAKSIHQDSRRTAAACLVEPAAFEPPFDAEQWLFGVGSRRTRMSSDSPEPVGPDAALDAARGGTIVLRGVVDWPTRTQARLARALRDGEVVTADGTSLDLEVRLITVADPAIDGAVADGRLRRDLFSRLAGLRIEVPPYRRRREDLPQLIAAQARHIANEAGIPTKAFTRAAITVLAALPWPRNGDDLRECLTALITRISRPVIELEDVLAHTCLDARAPVDTGLTLRAAKAQFERDCISAVLHRHHGRMGEAAKALGIQRTNLYRKVRQLKVARTAASARK